MISLAMLLAAGLAVGEVPKKFAEVQMQRHVSWLAMLMLMGKAMATVCSNVAPTYLRPRRSVYMANVCRFFVALLTGWMLLVPVSSSHAEDRKPEKVRILLLGDSTVIGSICRRQAPKEDHLEDVIRKLLAAEADLPPTEVLNQGRDGEYVQGLLQGRYEQDIAKLPRVDFVLIRYGLNDRVRRKEFAAKFPSDLRELIHRLQKDHKGCQVVLETVIPYFGDKADAEINDLIRQTAREEKVPLLDTHARFAAELKHGANLLTYRRVKLDRIPEKYRSLLPAGSVKGDDVVVQDNVLDAHLRDVPGWFKDRHPNLAGYHVIGDEAAKFLAPLVRARVKARR